MVVGKKSVGVGVLYWTVGIFFLSALVFLAMNYDEPQIGMAIVFDLVILLVTGIILVGYMRTPSKAIILNSDKSITLPGKKVTVSMSEVDDISYKRASARGIQYKWGKVIIITSDKKYKVNYISNCEAVAKALTKAMYEYRG